MTEETTKRANPKKNKDARRPRPSKKRGIVPGPRPSGLRDKSKYWPPEEDEKHKEEREAKEEEAVSEAARRSSEAPAESPVPAATEAIAQMKEDPENQPHQYDGILA